MGTTGVRAVRRWSEVPGGLPGLYWAGAAPSLEQLDQAWVAYLEEPRPPLVLKSSNIVVIDGQSGAVLYAGA
jgi:hypothetical protein